MNVTITVNGKRIQADVPAGQTLLQFLREQGYRSVKCGCETTNCGLCSVWMDEKTVLSCSVPVGCLLYTSPAFMPVAFEFNSQAIIAMGIMFIATTVETIGDVSGVANGGLNREATDKELQGGVMADGLGSILGAIFGVLPNTSFSQNVGLVAVTKVVNRFVIMTGAVFLILCGFCPKLSALFSVMPQSVLGGAAVIMFAMILVSGIQSLTREPLDERNGLIVALAIGLGVGIGNVPAVLAQLPSWVGNIFAQNGIIMTFVIATVLNLILPKKKSEEE